MGAEPEATQPEALEALAVEQTVLPARLRLTLETRTPEAVAVAVRLMEPAEMAVLDL